MSYRECTARSKRSGEKCHARAMDNSDVCYHHGGKSKRGADSPTFKTGDHSKYKYIPQRLLAVVEDARRDPELADVRNKIALVEALMNVKLQALFDDEGERHGDSFAVWQKLKALVKAARAAYKSESYAGLEDALDAMEDIANARLYRYEAEAEIKSDIEQWRKLVETEQRINLQGERAISADTVMLLVAQLINVVNTVVTDVKQRYAIADGIQRLVTTPQSTRETE